MNKPTIYTVALMLTLSACEMKNELWNSSKPSSNEAALELNVEAEEPVSLTRAAVSTDDFPVSIIGHGEVSNVIRMYDAASEVPSTITLPIGTYTITAHTPGELQRMMSAPYYLGDEDVTLNRTYATAKTINCTMANSRISIRLSDEFKSAFTDWTITINDGSSQALSYNENSDYADVFWYFENEPKAITVDIRATLSDGNSVFASNTYSKTNCNEGYTNIENDSFTGGDAIVINFAPETNPNGYITGITMVTTVTFDNYDESVTIEVKDEGADDVPTTEPDEPTPDPNAPSVPTDDIDVNFVYGRTFTVDYEQASDYPAVQVDFAFPTGLKNIYVSVSGSDDFEFACGLMHLTEGDGLDLASDAAKELENLFTLPKVGDKEYIFSLNETLWGLLTCTPGYPGTQKFVLKAVDKNGAVATGELTININE